MTTHAKVENNAEVLDRLISDYGPSKYQDIVRAMQWARHLRRQDAYRSVEYFHVIPGAFYENIFRRLDNFSMTVRIYYGRHRQYVFVSVNPYRVLFMTLEEVAELFALWMKF